MARGCGCTGSSCGCLIQAGDSSVTVSGIGTAADPYLLTASQASIAGQLTVNDSTSVDLTLVGDGTVADPYIMSADAKTVSVDETSYAATFGSSLDVGGGSVSGSYWQVGDTVIAKVSATLGSGFTFGGGSMDVSLPTILPFAWSTGLPVGQGLVTDDSTGATYAIVVVASVAGIVSLKVLGASGKLLDLSATKPFTFAAGDTIAFQVQFFTLQ